MRTKKKILSPTREDLIAPTYNAIKELGGSASINEITDKVVKDLKLPDKIVDEPHCNSQCTELEYQLAWSRTYLKKFGAIVNSARGIWRITPAFAGIDNIDVDAVKKSFRDKNSRPNYTEPPEELEPWKLELSDIIKNMNPFAFERLTQRLLRECGFSQVSVTKKTSDGGIDGFGKLKIGGIFTYNVAFQCKRYSGSVAASEIRDFRGSLTKNIEKGIFITTGNFTRQAIEEASNVGKQQIDLIDGSDFIDKLIEFQIGINAKTIYEVDRNYFEKI
ncbi:MAG: restriction endonuclease [Verrucomicrobia bacterium]|nr:MAG: restriction endonuclease [Verrucomicrobiota bacterium]